MADRLYLEQMLDDLASVERQTRALLGDDADYFLRVAFDWDEVVSHLPDLTLPGGYDLVVHTVFGLQKEIRWLQLFLLAGNYPLLLSRLRFIWESAFRAYFAEHYPMGQFAADPPGLSPDHKLDWLRTNGRQLSWDNCIEPVLRTVLPVADREPEVMNSYRERWRSLHRYVHPSADLAGRMIDDTALHVADNFDEEWAKESVELGSAVFDLVWLAVVRHRPAVFDRITKLWARYPVMSTLRPAS
jgi:hypothetical protein